MTAATVFVIKNQADLFLNKQGEWVDDAQPATLYRTVHRDEAVNTVFEVSAKDMYLRAEVLACKVDEKGQPALGQPVEASTEPVAIDDEASAPPVPDLEAPELSESLCNVTSAPPYCTTRIIH